MILVLNVKMEMVKEKDARRIVMVARQAASYSNMLLCLEPSKKYMANYIMMNFGALFQTEAF